MQKRCIALCYFLRFWVPKFLCKITSFASTKSVTLLNFNIVSTFKLIWHRNKVAACAKHYVGDGGTSRGINENNTLIDYRGLLNIHMPAYHDSIVKGVSTVMVSYSSWNGKKMHANHFLVTDYLKNKLKFRVTNKTSLISYLTKQLKWFF